MKWNFYVPDCDRSTGWTTHGYVLQFVCDGEGATAAEAWTKRLRAHEYQTWTGMARASQSSQKSPSRSTARSSSRTGTTPRCYSAR